MKAYILHGIGDIRYEDKEILAPERGEALIRVKAAGICGSDIPRIYTTGAHKHPIIPGHEFSGEIVKINNRPNNNHNNKLHNRSNNSSNNNQVDNQFNNESLIGKRAAVFPLIPCFECPQCKKGNYELCMHYDYIGSRRDGGFAEYVKVPLWNVFPFPDNVSFEEAAMIEPMAVAVHAMRIAGLINVTDSVDKADKVGKADEASSDTLYDMENEDQCKDKDKTICIFGLGTIGLLLYMFLREAGYSSILLLGNKELQREKCRIVSSKFGNQILYNGLEADNDHESDYDLYFLNTKTVEDPVSWIYDKTQGLGVDVFFDCVGKEEGISLGLMSAAYQGELIIVGNPYGDMHFTKDCFWKITRKQLKIKGVWNSSYHKAAGDDWNYVMSRLISGRISPSFIVTHRYDQEDLMKGLMCMRDKREEYIKIMSSWNTDE